MSSNFGLTDEEIIYELASAFHSNILDILGYGIYTSIYFVALYLIVSQGSERPRLGSAFLVTAMWVLVTIHASITWSKLDNMFILHGDTRETQIRWYISSQFDSFFLQYVADTIVTFSSLLFADVTMIWRCWVLYGRRWIIVVIPATSLVAGSVCYVWRTILQFGPHGVWQPDTSNNLLITFLSTTVLTNIFCTTAIVYRPLKVNGWRKSVGSYRRIVETLIESSVLYTAIYVIRIGLQIHSQYFIEDLDERVRFAQALGYSITGIAPTLIIACFAASHSRPTRHSLPPPNTKPTIRHLTASSRPDRSATVHTAVEDVDHGRSRFEEDSDSSVGDHSRSGGLVLHTAFRKGRVTFKDAQV